VFRTLRSRSLAASPQSIGSPRCSACHWGGLSSQLPTRIRCSFDASMVALMVGDVNVGFMQSFAKLCCGHPFVHELRTGCDFRFPEGKICTSKEIFNRSEGLKYSGNLQAFKGPLTTWYSTAKTDHYNTRTLYTTLYTVGRVSRKRCWCQGA